jgi:hypothetical protein
MTEIRIHSREMVTVRAVIEKHPSARAFRERIHVLIVSPRHDVGWIARGAVPILVPGDSPARD